MLRWRVGVVVMLVVMLGASACSEGGGDSGASDSDDPAPVIPSGTYTTRIPASDFRGVDAAPPGVLEGRWTLNLDLVGDRYTLEQDAFGPTSGELHIAGPGLSFDEVPAPEGTFNCFEGEGRTTSEGLGEYEFEVEGDTVTFLAAEERCPLREVLLARTWQRL